MSETISENAFLFIFEKSDPVGRWSQKTAASRRFSAYLLDCLVKIHKQAEGIFLCLLVYMCSIEKLRGFSDFHIFGEILGFSAPIYGESKSEKILGFLGFSAPIYAESKTEKSENFEKI